MTTAAKLKCKHGCGYESGHQGAMNLHEKIHCKTLKSGAPKSKPEKTTSKPSGTNRQCDCDDGGSWRFLTTIDPRDAFLMSHGFKKICEECDEVIS